MAQGGGFSGIWRLFALLFKLKGAVPLTLIMILLMSIGSISESITEGSPAPFFENVGGMVLNYDQTLYENSLDIQEQGGIYLSDEKFTSKLGALWEGVKYMGNILYGWWIFYVLIILFMKIAELLFTHNESNNTGNILIAIMIVAGLQIFGSFVILDPGINDFQNLELSQKVIPFRGMYESIKTTPLVFNPVYNKVNKYENVTIDDNTINNIKQDVVGGILNDSYSPENISGTI